MAGKASTTMFVFSSLSRGAPPPAPPVVHPAASIVTATADAMSAWRGFILLHQALRRRSRPRDRLGEHRDRQRRLVTSRTIIMFRTVRHMPNAATCPNLAPLRY